MPPATEPTVCGSPGQGSGGGAQTEAFPVGERSEAPREAPQERPQCAPSSSPTSLQCRSRGPAAGSAARLRPRPRPLGAPRIRPRRFGHSPRSQPSPSSSPRRSQTGRPRRPKPIGCWGPGGASVGSWEESTPPPSAPDAAAFLHTWHFLPVLLRRAAFCAGRGPDGPAEPATGRLRIRQVGKTWRGEGKEKWRLGALGVCVFGGVRVRDLSLGSAVRALGRACARVVWRSDGRRS